MNSGATYFAKLNRSAAQNCDEIVANPFAAVVAGTLTVTNIGGSLTNGDTFFLFSSAVSGVFTNINLPTGYTWTNQLAVNGSIQVLSSGSGTVSPTNLTFVVANGSITISWPANSGWILQTNDLKVTVSSDWHDVPTSQTTNQLSFPLNSPGIGNEYFRLRHP
jgi:hypothetical protein